jgi:hypothetical protein
VLYGQQWSDFLFASIFNEVSLENKYTRYWNKYLSALSESKGGERILEQLILNVYRKEWLDGSHIVHRLRRSKRFIEHETVVQKCFDCHGDNPLTDTIRQISADDIELWKAFPQTF